MVRGALGEVEMSVAAVIERLLASDPEPAVTDDVAAWWASHRSRTEPGTTARATLGGFAADRVGWAFAAGYQSAGEALFGDGSRSDVLTALCATEKGGVHPRAIATSLREDPSGRLRLDGEKSFVTFGSEARRLLVVAKAGEREDGTVELRLIRIDRRDGVTVVPQPGVPFCPEVPHATLVLEAVAVEPGEVLPGDGYLRYLKPFRTVEDIHVHLALLGWLVQVGRRSGWPDATLERLVAAIAALDALGNQSAGSAGVHVALGGALAETSGLVRSLDWSTVDETTRSRWERDRALLGVAGKARVLRLEAAWRALRR